MSPTQNGWGEHLMSTTRCKGTNVDGEACGAPESMVDPETGYCPAHGPGGRNEMKERGRKGGKQTHQTGLHPTDLPALDSFQAAQEWLEEIGRAVACGRLGDREANAAIRAVSEWRETESERVTREELEELQAQLEQLSAEIEDPAVQPLAG